MSRPLKVPREQAIKAAMYVFWAKGYNTTTVDDLQNAMGIQRGSFYFHFKDKRSLFMEVLDYYRQAIVEKRRDLVRSCSSPKAGIELYFKILLNHLLEQKSNAGCLNTSSATEFGVSDFEISKKLAISLNGWQDFWIEILKKAKDKKEISENLDLTTTAQLLVGITQGLNVLARVNPDSDFLNGIVKAGLAGLSKYP